MSIDGSTGYVIFGRLKTIEASVSGDFETVMSWRTIPKTKFALMPTRYRCRNKPSGFGAEAWA